MDSPVLTIYVHICRTSRWLGICPRGWKLRCRQALGVWSVYGYRSPSPRPIASPSSQTMHCRGTNRKGWSKKIGLKWLCNIVSDSETNPGCSSCCNDNYKPLGESETPWVLQANRLSDYQDIYDWKLKFQKNIFLTVLITLQSIGENEYGKTGHSRFLLFWGKSWSSWRALF